MIRARLAMSRPEWAVRSLMAALYLVTGQAIHAETQMTELVCEIANRRMVKGERMELGGEA